MEYEDYKKLIQKISWSWNRTTNIEFETLEAEANLVFVECLNKYNPEKSKFSTFLQISICSHFKNLINKNSIGKRKGTKVQLYDNIVTNVVSIEHEYIIKDIIKKLSKESQMIIDIVLETPIDLLKMLPKHQLSKHQLMKYLLFHGWKKSIILQSFKEIKNNLLKDE